MNTNRPKLHEVVSNSFNSKQSLFHEHMEHISFPFSEQRSIVVSMIVFRARRAYINKHF